MKYIKHTLDFHVEEATVITLGKFDGLHRGHELLMQKLHEKSREGLSTVVFTFDIPPQVRMGEQEALLLTTNEEKVHIFAQTGIDYLIECPFTDAVRSMEPEAFIRWICGRLHVKCIVAGKDFHFGCNRAGDYHTLQKYDKTYGYEAVILDKIQENGRDISSTYIREEICRGEIAHANRLLGYPFFVEGTVVQGNRIGHTIGFPTVNLIPTHQKLLPPNGVYVTQVCIGEEVFRGVTNVGKKPTIPGEYPVGVETYILDFDRQIYGEQVHVEFLAPLRPEIKFDSVEALVEQMRADTAAASEIFSTCTVAG